MQEKDVPHVHSMLQTYLSNKALHIELSEGEVRHYLLPREGVLDSFVVEDKDSK